MVISICFKVRINDFGIMNVIYLEDEFLFILIIWLVCMFWYIYNKG